LITALQPAALSMRGRDDIAGFIEVRRTTVYLDYLVDEGRTARPTLVASPSTCRLSRLSAELATLS
jgi:hypothetical protein